MSLKRILAACLCLALLVAAVPCTFSVSAQEEDPMNNYVLHTIWEARQYTQSTNGSTGLNTYGMGWKKNLAMSSTTAVAGSNLALSMRFYFLDLENPTNTSLLTPANNLYLSTASEGGGKTLNWKTNALKTVDGGALQPGVWNDILLPFSGGTNYANFNFTTEYFDFFWMEFSGIPESTYLVRMADVTVVDTSRRAATPEEPEWDTTYEAATIPFSLQKAISGQGANTTAIAVARTFSAIDVSAHNPEKLQLLMDITVNNVTTPGNANVLAGIGGQVELTSSGTCDHNEAGYNVGNLALTHGTQEYAIPLSAFSSTGGAIDLSAINYMRIYINTWPADLTDTIQLTVSNVRLVDITDQVFMPTLFSDGMMFQQNKPMAIWGPGRAGDVATLKLYRGEELLETKTATTDATGRWETAFSARAGGYTAYTIEVTVGNTLHKVIRDVVIGEVWIASGQSNMELTVARDMDAEQIKAAADDPYIRLFLEPTRPYGTQALLDPGSDVPGAVWGYGDSAMHVARASAIGYTFALNLKKELDVPIGIIDASVGGTVIEAWLPRTAIAANATLKTELLKRSLYYDEDFWSSEAGTMSTWYNQKIGPLEGMNIAGVIWYQGESNSNRSEIYDQEIDLLKTSWGAAFGFPNGDMPLIFTQVAPYRYDNGNNQHLGYLAMYMERGWKRSADKNTAMLTIYDLPLEHMKDGVSSDPIHPRVKTPVAERFAQSALNMVYGGEEEYTAPVYKSMEIQDGAIYVTFDRVGDGLKTIDGTDDLHGFTIAGADGVYVNAEAEIVDADTVKVWNNRVNEPANVIYAFDNFNQAANLCNSSGIPASPLRTVQLNDTTLKKDSSVIYFTAQDWMLADRDVWVYDATFTEERKTGYRPSFAVTGGTYRYDNFLTAEGTGALRVSHNQTTTVSPILSYESIKQSWSRFKTLSVKLLNPDEGDTIVSMTATCGTTTYTVPTVDGADFVTLSGKSDTYTQVTFDLTALKLNGVAAFNPAGLLSSLKEVTFHLQSANAGTLLMDAFSFGLTAPLLTDAAINAAAEEVAPSVQTAKEWLRQYAVNEADFREEILQNYRTTKAALEAVLNDADATPLARGDAAAAWLSAVKAVLALQDVDTEALRAAVDAAITDLSGYTADSAAAYQAALEAARAVLDNVTASQADVDEALAALTAAKDALQPKPEDTGLLGDVNGDGDVTSTDARMVLQYAVKKIAADALDLTVADVDGNGEYTSTDARLILQRSVNKIAKFPIEE